MVSKRSHEERKKKASVGSEHLVHLRALRVKNK